jgi:hypothetical protein
MARDFLWFTRKIAAVVVSTDMQSVSLCKVQTMVCHPNYCSTEKHIYLNKWDNIETHPSTPTLGPTQPPVWGYRVSFPGVKRPGYGVNHPSTAFSAEFKETVELYLYFSSGLSRHVLGRTLLFLHFFQFNTVDWKDDRGIISWKGCGR